MKSSSIRVLNAVKNPRQNDCNNANDNKESGLENTLIWWKIADISLDIFHAFLLFFIGSGWVFNKTRRTHLLGLGLVSFSWVGLGFWHGWGYCVMTDVHWNIKRHLGQSDLPASFISYMLKRGFDLSVPDSQINMMSYVILIMVIVMSVTLNIRDYRIKSKANPLECNEFA